MTPIADVNQAKREMLRVHKELEYLCSVSQNIYEIFSWRALIISITIRLLWVIAISMT